jgi:hypothetical protein
MTHRTLSALAVLCVIAGCSSNPCAGNPGACGGAGSGTCAGACAPTMPTLTVVTLFLWSGAEGDTPPACPAGANALVQRGFLENAPANVTCSECTCGPSQNGCFPPTAITAQVGTCPGGVAMPFGAPSGWDGTCTAMDPVSSAGSITTAPPVLGLGGQCGPNGSTATTFSGGAIQAITCAANASTGILPGTCGDPSDVCTLAKTPGFERCAWLQDNGDTACPAGWPVHHVLYELDQSCQCTCGPPSGEGCSATITAYSDGACGTPLGSQVMTLGQAPECFDVTAGSHLGSKAATVSYTAGTCQPSLTKLAPRTLCCLE